MHYEMEHSNDYTEPLMNAEIICEHYFYPTISLGFKAPSTLHKEYRVSELDTDWLRGCDHVLIYGCYLKVGKSKKIFPDDLAFKSSQFSLVTRQNCYR